MRQHEDRRLIPPLRHLEFVGQGAHIHDLARVPDRHLDERVARGRPQVNCGLRNRPVEPELVRLVGREVLVRQVGVVVAVQPGHLDLAAVVSDVELAHGQRIAAGFAHSVVLDALAGIDVVPKPLIVDPSGHAGVFQRVPSRSVGRILKQNVETAACAGQNPNGAGINRVICAVIDRNVAIWRCLLADCVDIVVKSVRSDARRGRIVANRAVHRAIQHIQGVHRPHRQLVDVLVGLQSEDFLADRPVIDALVGQCGQQEEQTLPCGDLLLRCDLLGELSAAPDGMINQRLDIDDRLSNGSRIRHVLSFTSRGTSNASEKPLPSVHHPLNAPPRPTSERRTNPSCCHPAAAAPSGCCQSLDCTSHGLLLSAQRRARQTTSRLDPLPTTDFSCHHL